ncbi:MAG: 30S ribosomal protein S16 [Planctomycetota bacterium]
MAVKIRLKRMGRKNRPFYRIVVADARTQRDGTPIEIIGHYDPISRDSKNWDLKRDRAAYWLSVGAQPSETVTTFLKREEIWPREKAVAHWAEVKDQPAAVAAPVAEAASAVGAPVQEAPAQEPKAEQDVAQEAQVSETLPEAVKTEEETN